MIRVAIKRPSEPARVTQIDGALETLQGIVGGYIECVPITDEFVIICDEEGRINGKRLNCSVNGVVFYGTIIFAGVDGADFADLPDDVLDSLRYRLNGLVEDER